MHRFRWMASTSVLALLAACVQLTTAPYGGGPSRPTGQPSVPFTELLSVLEGAGYVVSRVIKDDQSLSPGVGSASVQTGVVVVSPNSCLPKVQAVVFGAGGVASPDARKEVAAATPSPGALRYEAYQVLAADQLKYGADQASATTVIKVESC